MYPNLYFFLFSFFEGERGPWNESESGSNIFVYLQVIIMRNGFFHDEEFDILFSLIRSLRKIILDQVTKRMLWIGVSDDDSLTLRFVDCDARMQFQSWKSSILDFLRCIEKRSRDFLKKKRERKWRRKYSLRIVIIPLYTQRIKLKSIILGNSQAQIKEIRRRNSNSNSNFNYK